MKVYRDTLDEDGKVIKTVAVFDIMEATYSGQDMGKRSIVATIKFPTPIDFKIGDYIELRMSSLEKDGMHGAIPDGVVDPYERFYIYTEPQCKKTARPMSIGDAFETTVTFYPRQYELSCIQMRDFIQAGANEDQIMYTGFDNVTFYGGAYELMERCMACLAQHYKDKDGNPLWTYQLAPSLNENQNNALERYTFSFSQNSVMDALMKLNDKDYINTTFFINGRTIYVGYKRPYLCKVNAQGAITNTPLSVMYGKTSDQPIDIDHGGLHEITKTVGEEMPITKLFAYGAARNLNRHYCADRIKSGRFVNKLMLPGFSDDGETDWIISEDGVKKYGIREGSKTFDEIYPSLRYMTYADIRGIKYCIKIKTSGLDADTYVDGKMTHQNSNSTYPVARVQCYKVTPCDGTNGTTVGVNKLVECAPPEDLVVFIHAVGKTVKIVLMGDDGVAPSDPSIPRSVERQLAHDYKVPTRDGVSDWIVGSCFCVHDNGFDGQYDYDARIPWFTEDATAINDRDSNFQRIEYVDTFWLTDLYVFESYDQRSFKRDGYSAWGWPRYNNESNYPDSLPVNEVVAVEPVVIPDTSDNLSGGRQQHFDIYLRDVGFQLDEQNDFGEMVFVFSTPVVSVLDGILAGREFTIDGGDNLNDYQNRVCCAYREDGTFNMDFMEPGNAGDEGLPARALLQGAMWRIRLNRNDKDEYLSSIGIVIPNTDIQMKAGDHIVLLDIYMPDIYIRAAEQRLFREARQFLEKNDKGNVKYAINFDKVRFNQIPNYALQMREGVLLRVIDEDLNITSENIVRDIVKHNTPSSNQVQLFNEVSNIEVKLVETIYEYESRTFRNIIKTYDRDAHIMRIFIPSTSNLAEYDKIRLIKNSDTTYGHAPQNQVSEKVEDGWLVSFTCDDNLYYTWTRAYRVEVILDENVPETTYEKKYNVGSLVPAIIRDYINFKAGKYYEIVLDVEKSLWSLRNNDIMLSRSPEDVETVYTIPRGEYSCKISTKQPAGKKYLRVIYSFYLPDSFNDEQGYYIALRYMTLEGEVDYGEIRLVSVTEKDLDSKGNVVNYVDFLVSSVNIKLTDNTRPANIEDVDYEEAENERERYVKNAPEPIYDISAQIVQQTKASTWGQVMNTLEKNRIEQEQTKKTYEMLANAARQNYDNLLSLKNNIFDPDGTCNETFLQVMMLQVGADSMNYQLDRTLTTPTGVMSNFSVSGRDVLHDLYDVFRVMDADVLHHFVYTKGAGNAGTWQIRGDFEQVLEPTRDEQDNITGWPTYYVCIRCKKDNVNDLTQVAWICSTDQYAVNQDKVPSTGATVNEYGELVSDFWYFNWGILTADSDGHYTLKETRGNAYMYGDNIVCGKISTIAGNSFFDLTHGNFVLSQQGPDSEGKYHEGMTYIDGKLTIWGLTPDSIDNLISQMSEAGAFNTNLWAIDEKYGFRLADREMYMLSCIHDDEFPDGREYTFSCEITEYTPDEVHGTETGYTYFGVKLTYTVNDGEEKVLWSDYGDGWGTREFSGNGKVGPRVLSVREFLDAILEYGFDDGEDHSEDDIKITGIQMYVEPHLSFSEYVSFNIEKGFITRGNKESAYTLGYKHIADAMQGSTEVMGGLTMTNLLFLKNERGEVTSGMSGLTDNGEVTIDGQELQSEGVTLWGGGTYEQALKQATSLVGQLQNLIPVLLTKTGIGSKIGCFMVDSHNQVSVNSFNGDRIIINSGESVGAGPHIDFYRGNDMVVRITSDAIDEVETDIVQTSTIGDNVYRKVVDYEDSPQAIAPDVTVGYIDLSKKAKYNATYTNANYLKIQCSLQNLLYTSPINNVLVYFDVYMGEKRIGTYRTQYDTISGSSQPTLRSYYASFINPGESIEGGNYAITIRNARAYGRRDNGVLHCLNLYIQNITIGTGTVVGTEMTNWINGNINFTNASVSCIIIGNNGMKIENNYGGYVCILNDKQNTYFRISGLPVSNSNLKQGQLYRQEVGLSNFRTKLNSLFADYIKGSSKEQGFSAVLSELINSIPASIVDIGINQ